MKLLLVVTNELFTDIFSKYLVKNNINFITLNILYESIDLIENIIKENEITNIICNIGKSYGKNIFSTNYIEEKLNDNLKFNLYIPMIVSNICINNKVHFTFIGNGCVFKDYDSKLPDLEVSSHSIVTGYNDMLMNNMFSNILYLRLRYPISGNHDPRCHLMKLYTYNKVIDINNSITILDDIFPIILHMLNNKIEGNFNLSPINMNLLDLKLKIKYSYDSNLNINAMTLDEHNNIVGERSNCIVNNDLFKEYCIKNNLQIDNSLDDILGIMVNDCYEIKKCLCCNGKINNLLNLGLQPLANNFHNKDIVNSVYPLRLVYCDKCFHCQLSHSVNPKILFENYKYVSGTSQTGLDFFRDNCNFIHNYKKKSGKILDIACNDGSQLNYFKELDWETYGVDPAKNLYSISKEKGHNIICDFWRKEVAGKLPIMDVIVAQNVFAHTRYIDDFLQTCKIVMDENTNLFIQTSQRDMIINGEFDTTYHEHISFFNTKSMNILTTRNGLVLNRIMESSIHGRSYIFEIKLKRDNSIYNVEENIEIEKNLGIYNPITYEKFRLNTESCIINLKLIIEKYKNLGYKITGFGAAAKGQTLICYGNIDLDYIIDENPLKIGLYSPKLDIPIVSVEHFKEDKDDKILIIILAWNFAKEIKEKINKKKGNKTIVIVEKYFPKIVLRK